MSLEGKRRRREAHRRRLAQLSPVKKQSDAQSAPRKRVPNETGSEDRASRDRDPEDLFRGVQFSSPLNLETQVSPGAVNEKEGYVTPEDLVTSTGVSKTRSLHPGRKVISILDAEDSYEGMWTQGSQADRRNVPLVRNSLDKDFEVEVGDDQAFERERIQWADDSDLDEDDQLMRTIKIQESRRQSQIAASDDRTEDGLTGDTYKVTSIKDNWENTYLCLDPDYFSTPEARLEVKLGHKILVSGKKKKNNYGGLAVNQTNNKDVALVYERVFKRRGDNATDSDQYHNFKTCIGQLIRCAIANEKIELEDIW